jgi:hypothetical protein
MRGKTFKTTKKTNFIVFVICVLLVLILGYYLKREAEIIKEKGKLSIGTVLMFDGSKPTIKGLNQPGRFRSVQFEIVVDGKKYFVNQSSYFFSKIPSTGVEVGQKYLVKYLESDPRKSLMLFDYPIRDSSDFKNYINVLGSVDK